MQIATEDKKNQNEVLVVNPIMCYEIPVNKKGLTHYLVRVNFNCRGPVFFFIAKAMWLGKMGKFISPAYIESVEKLSKKTYP